MTWGDRHETRPPAPTATAAAVAPPNHKPKSVDILASDDPTTTCVNTTRLLINKPESRSRSQSHPRTHPRPHLRLRPRHPPFDNPKSHLSSHSATAAYNPNPASRTLGLMPSRKNPSSHTSSRPHTMATSKRNSAFSEADLQNFMMLQTADLSIWMTAIAIDDDDLTFSGKSLSTWYEEDRRRLSIGDLEEVISREEEHRGRSRERPTHREDTHNQHRKSNSKDFSGHSSN